MTKPFAIRLLLPVLLLGVAVLIPSWFSPVSSSFAQPAANGKKYAVLVGVEWYEHARLREPQPLKYSVDDAADMADVLRKYGYEVVLMTDDTGKKDAKLVPSRANIEAQIETVLSKCKSADTVILGFAGHGLQFAGDKDAYFCPVDAKPFPDELGSMVSLTKVYSKLERSFAGVKLIMVDACRNDPDPGRGPGLDADSVPPPKGVGALFSCSAGQKAFEHDELKHGVFFHYVLEGLKGEAADKSGEITFDGLSAYVRKAVPSRVATLFDQRQQFPNLKADLVGVPPVLARVSVSVPRPLPIPTPKPVPPANDLGVTGLPVDVLSTQ